MANLSSALDVMSKIFNRVYSAVLRAYEMLYFTCLCLVHALHFMRL